MITMPVNTLVDITMATQCPTHNIPRQMTIHVMIWISILIKYAQHLISSSVKKSKNGAQQ